MTAIPTMKAALPAPAKQLELFGWLIKLYRRDLLKVPEVAEITTLSRQSIDYLVQAGKLDGFGFELSGEREKQKRITVSSLCRYLLESALMTDEDRAEVLAVFVEKLDARSLAFLAERVPAQLAKLRRARA